MRVVFARGAKRTCLSEFVERGEASKITKKNHRRSAHPLHSANCKRVAGWNHPMRMDACSECLPNVCSIECQQATIKRQSGATFQRQEDVSPNEIRFGG